MIFLSQYHFVVQQASYVFASDIERTVCRDAGKVTVESLMRIHVTSMQLTDLKIFQFSISMFSNTLYETPTNFLGPEPGLSTGDGECRRSLKS